MKLFGQNAFTLIEILLVVIILGILTAMVVPNFAGRGEQARQTAARTDIEANIAIALDLYQLDNGSYPTTEQGLAALIEKPLASPDPVQWSGPYIKKKAIPRDPWGREYVYLSPGGRNVSFYDLFSLGKDGIESEDDITNWEN